MRTFAYVGRDRKNKKVKGILTVRHRLEAWSQLREKRLVDFKIKEIEPPQAKSKKKGKKKGLGDIQITWGPFGAISDKELLIFTKKLATMVRSGLPILDSLNLVHDQVKSAIFKSVIENIIENVNSGVSLSVAISRHPRYFDAIYRNLVEAGEMTGRLDNFLDRIVSGMERMQAIKSGIKSALFYPLTLVVVTLGIVYFMLTNVVPTFVEMYSNMGAKLPAPTQMIVDASNWILDGGNLLKVVGLILGVIYGHKLLMKYAYPYKVAFSGMLLKFPLFGQLIVKSTVARTALLMSNLFAAGIGVNEIMRVAANTSTNVLFIEAQNRIAEKVLTGVPLSELFAAEPVFPVELSQLIKVGEQTAGMDEMLESIARYYQEEFEATVKGLTTIIEPLMIVFVGGMVGVLVVALYLPIFSLGDTIK